MHQSVELCGTIFTGCLSFKGISGLRGGAWTPSNISSSPCLLQVDYAVIASQAGATLNNLLSHAQELVAKLRSLQLDQREFVCLKFLVLFSLGKFPKLSFFFLDASLGGRGSFPGINLVINLNAGKCFKKRWRCGTCKRSIRGISREGKRRGGSGRGGRKGPVVWKGQKRKWGRKEVGEVTHLVLMYLFCCKVHKLMLSEGVLSSIWAGNLKSIWIIYVFWI